MATMKAVRMHDYGGPDVLTYEDVPRPKPKSGEILVRIYAASVNPIDLMIRNGDAKAMVSHLPYILGWDLAGIVEQVGAGVEGYVPGDAVYANVGPKGGGYAEYAAIPALSPPTNPPNWTL
jgi:NADPH:quinone reductase-like Zn-dependent oxidoreductase